MLILCGILNTLAVLVAVLGLFAGTAGLSLIGAACLMAILARECQASHQHDALLATLNRTQHSEEGTPKMA